MLDFVALQPERCFGCEACASRCPLSCIQMEEDAEGFRYPVVDTEACTGCGACERVCAALAGVPDGGSASPAVLAAWSHDRDVRRESSSGGVFPQLASAVLSAGGVVVGAHLDTALELRHVAIEDAALLPLLRGSKYIPSATREAFVGVRARLRAGRRVLFAGTPCQVGGLRRYLECDHEKLVTCDLVCHGVPSARVFRSYVEWRESRAGAGVTGFRFRDKRSGWKRYSIVATLEDGRAMRCGHDDDPFMRGFLRDLYLRPSCHVCPYSTVPRAGDLTLGDFWGVSRSVAAKLDDDRGTSLVLVNTPRGQAALDEVRSSLRAEPATLTAAVAGNPCLSRPAAPSARRAEFMRAFATRPFEEVVAAYLTDASPFHVRARRRAGRLLRPILEPIRRHLGRRTP